MPNLNSLSSITTTATALSNLILVSPTTTIGYQPLNPPKSDGTPSNLPQKETLVFMYEGEQTALIESDITDHYIEDNSAIQDQIALRPEVITTRGFIGELNDIAPSFLKPLEIAADKLNVISSFTPELSTTAILAYDEAFFAYQLAASLANSAVSAWAGLTSLFGDTTGQVVDGSGVFTVGSPLIQNKQQNMFQQFYSYWRNRILFQVQTPWAVFNNMAIKSLRAIQDAETNTISDFEITFKMIRVASTTTNEGQLASLLGGRAGSQNSAISDNGTSPGGQDQSFSSSLSTQTSAA